MFLGLVTVGVDYNGNGEDDDKDIKVNILLRHFRRNQICRIFSAEYAVSSTCLLGGMCESKSIGLNVALSILITL